MFALCLLPAPPIICYILKDVYYMTSMNLLYIYITDYRKFHRDNYMFINYSNYIFAAIVEESKDDELINYLLECLLKNSFCDKKLKNDVEHILSQNDPNRDLIYYTVRGSVTYIKHMEIFLFIATYYKFIFFFYAIYSFIIILYVILT